LDLKVEDTLSTGVGTVNAVKKLIELDRLKLILGPTWLDSFQGALPIAQRHGVLLLTPSAGISNFKKSSADYPLVFSTYFNFEREIVSLVENGANLGVRRLAFLFDQDPYFQSMRSFARDTAQRLGLSIVFDHDFAPGEKDFRALLQRLQAQKPDAVVFGSVDEGSVFSFLKQRGELAPALRILGTHDLDSYTSNKNFAGLLKNTHYIVPAESSLTFKNAYRERFELEPLMSASNAYDAVMMLAVALNSGVLEPEAIAKFLREQQFATATFGPARFSVLGGIENGDFVMKKSQS
jgi:branched-chain amino acid transport system substrate-binding protein